MPNYLEAPKRNALLGLLSDAAGRVNAFAQTPDPTMPMGKANPLLSLLSEFAGVPSVHRTLDKLSKGEPITNADALVGNAAPATASDAMKSLAPFIAAGMKLIPGVPALNKSLDEVRYGSEIANAGKTVAVPVIPQDTVNAAMALAPIAQIAGKYTGKAANSIADASVRAITRNPQATAAGVLDYAAQMRPATPATVWHGSPHKFDAFDSSKIGTGEGSQAFGHGLYLAEAPEVSRQYAALAQKPGLKQGSAIGNDMGVLDGLIKLNARKYTNGDVVQLAELVKKRPAAFAKSDEMLSRIGEYVDNNPPSYLYKVDLPDEKIARMLDWDKPLSQQPKEVREALTKIAQSDEQIMKVFRSLGPNAPANQAYAALTERAVRLKKYEGMRNGIPEHEAIPSLAYGQDAASRSLRELGIPGIRYLDGMSRGTGTGTTNFVVFPGEENALTILERNGKPVR